MTRTAYRRSSAPAGGGDPVGMQLTNRSIEMYSLLR
jgi:hypothetical protein